MPPAHSEFFYFGICHLCKNDSKIHRCSSCKTVAYCSKQHQKSDWKNHKELCRAIAVTSKTMNQTENFTYEQWKNFRVSCHVAWMDILKRQLQPFECQMWMFPRVCAVCYSTNDLIDCTGCRNVAYCSLEHMRGHESHKRFCSDLKLCMDIDKYLSKTNSYPQIDLKQQFSTEDFPDDLQELMQVIEVKNREEIFERVLKADSIAPGAIILYAMKISKQSKPNLIVHIVGASLAEGTADWRIATELLFHWSTNLQQITYYLIGPEAWSISDVDSCLELCQMCKDNRKVLKVKVYKQLYHEVDGIEKPDMVVSFNSGLHEFEGQNCDEWKESIPLLVKDEVPFVFTSYTEEEMLRDLQRIKDLIPGVSILVSGKNLFASPRPIRDWCTENIPVFYSNGYISVVKQQEML